MMLEGNGYGVTLVRYRSSASSRPGSVSQQHITSHMGGHPCSITQHQSITLVRVSR
jgi:hypothetical protein